MVSAVIWGDEVQVGRCMGVIHLHNTYSKATSFIEKNKIQVTLLNIK